MRSKNTEFLKTIFRDDWETAHVTSFTDDPSNISQERRGFCWNGHYANIPLKPGNQYFTVSRFHSLNNRAIRRESQFIAMYMLVADDVREKLPLEKINKLPSPTYKLLTSANSEQWGWVLSTPCTNRLQCKNLLDGLISHGLAPDGKDPGMKGVTRYIRLPDGYNSKKSRVINGKPFQCQLLEFYPWQTSSIEELAAPFGVDLNAVRRDTKTNGAANVDHPLMDVVEIKEVKSDGRFDITCPWVDEHTDGQDDGTAVFTNSDLSIGFKCHHGHCEDKTGKDLIEWIEESNPGWSKELDTWKVYRSLHENNPEIVNSTLIPSPPLISLDILLRDLRKKPSSENLYHVYEILKLADKLTEYAEKIKVWDTVKDYMQWTNKHFDIILKEQRKIWYQSKKNGKIEKYSTKETIPTNKFPNIRESRGTLKATIENLKYMIDCYRITAFYDVITKDTINHVPGINQNMDGSATVTIEKIISLAAMNDLPTSAILNQMVALAYDNPVNPVTDHLKNLRYKGNGYIELLGSCIQTEDEDQIIKNKIFRMYMIGACAAADYSESTPRQDALPKFEYVMVLVGGQGAEKTTFFRSMLPTKLRQYFKNGQFLDPSDKDSVLKNIRYWINELGELEGTFKKADINRLKAFLSESDDVLRQPYGRVMETYKRRTIFVGSVNEEQFLKDHTGNRRYWPLLIKKILLPTNQEVINNAWAEAWYSYISGEQWWPTPEIETELDIHRISFQSPLTEEPVEDAIRYMIKMKKDMFSRDILTINDIRNGLRVAGLIGQIYKIPSNAVIGKVLIRYKLGILVRTAQKRYWVIRNPEKYMNLKSSEIEKCYQRGLVET